MAHKVVAVIYVPVQYNANLQLTDKRYVLNFLLTPLPESLNLYCTLLWVLNFLSLLRQDLKAQQYELKQQVKIFFLNVCFNILFNKNNKYG